MSAITRKSAWIALCLLFILGACKKDDKGPVDPPQNPANDSMYFLFKDEYLWTDAVPDSAQFKPGSYANLKDMFDALIAFKKKDGTDEPLDKYSFLDDGTVSGEIDQGVAGDFGLEVDYNDENDLRVIYVYENSPAYQKGIRRTWQITAINGDTRLTYDSQNGQNGPNVQRIVNALYRSNSVTLTLKKPDGTSVDVSLNTANYSINPILYSNVFSVGGKKVGYVVFNQFISLDVIKSKIDPVFDNFISNNITDLIVDLRYNGGGSVETAEYLANLIAPASVGNNQTLMYTETFNANLTNHQYSNYLRYKMLPPPYQTESWGDWFDYYVDNATVNFRKQKTLNINNVVFIGTGSTASASELLFNVLKPYMNAKWVGQTTYGKPVGFVGIRVGGYDMYAVSIWSKNSQGFGDYFDGFAPDDNPTQEYQFEDYSKDWGSFSEIYLRRALMQLGISEGALGRRAPGAENLRTLKVGKTVPDLRFKGMIETRLRLNRD